MALLVSAQRTGRGGEHGCYVQEHYTATAETSLLHGCHVCGSAVASYFIFANDQFVYRPRHPLFLRMKPVVCDSCIAGVLCRTFVLPCLLAEERLVQVTLEKDLGKVWGFLPH